VLFSTGMFTVASGGDAYLAADRVAIVVYRTGDVTLFFLLYIDLFPYFFAFEFYVHIDWRGKEVGSHSAGQ
jgi:hypothetical protein